MTTSNASGGSSNGSGGTADNKQDNQTQDNNADTVAYDTYRKVLSEKKKRDEELLNTKKQLDELLAKEKEREEKALKEKEDWKKLLEIREKEKAELSAKNSQMQEMISNGIKRRAFLDAVNGQIDEQYWGLIDLGGIVIDPETGAPDESSVNNVAREFEKHYPLVLKSKSGGPKLPNDAAMGSGKKLTYEEWLKLPTKDQRARMKEVIG